MIIRYSNQIYGLDLKSNKGNEIHYICVCFVSLLRIEKKVLNFRTNYYDIRTDDENLLELNKLSSFVCLL